MNVNFLVLPMNTNQLNVLINEIIYQGTITRIVDFLATGKLIVACTDGLKRQIELTETEVIWIDSYSQ
ncbi:MAG TPA: hypothetical protein DDW51_05670 [Cyanobacteria bacterium UBA11367]|nr:hypothetical protein [Cyanobacteria bacterium UBA11367]HBE56771.1 hypothetical protein [Cyanobacteria bacterium UBA11366]HCA95976.1 hypothetical protein [Cyanobacteria bacterium UBA9226]